MADVYREEHRMTQASAEPYTNVLLYRDTNTLKMCRKVHAADNNARSDPRG